MYRLTLPSRAVAAGLSLQPQLTEEGLWSCQGTTAALLPCQGASGQCSPFACLISGLCQTKASSKNLSPWSRSHPTTVFHLGHDAGTAGSEDSSAPLGTQSSTFRACEVPEPWESASPYLEKLYKRPTFSRRSRDSESLCLNLPHYFSS